MGHETGAAQYNDMEKRRRQIFRIIQIGQKDDIASRTFDYVIIAAILANVTVLILETFEQMTPYLGILHAVETVTIVIFCIEYLCRIWTADLLYPDLPPARARLKFLYSFDGIVDLCTILPFFFLEGFVVFRILRVARILHLFRINTNYDSFHVIVSVLYNKRNQMISSVFLILVLMLASSLCLYSVEHNAQPDVFKNAFSGIWWAMSTIFTVGYGDIYPVTLLGKCLAVVITFLGVGAVAIPTGIISAGFVEQYTNMSASGSPHPENAVTVTVLVDEDSAFCGRRVRDAELEKGITVAAILRDGAILVPSDGLVIREGDTMVYQQKEE